MDDVDISKEIDKAIEEDTLEDNFDDDWLFATRHPNPNRPKNPLVIQQIFGDENILNFLLNDYDSVMRSFVELHRFNPDKIWAYQGEVYSDLKVAVKLSNAENKELISQKLKEHFERTRSKKVTKGRVKGTFKGDW